MYKKTRICKYCGCTIKYKTYYTFYQAEKNNYGCSSCAAKNRVKKYQNGLRGKSNPFYGKKHSKETRKKLSERDMSGWDMSRDTKGKKNSMYGRSVYNIWVEKYGIDEANKLESERKRKLSEANSGEKNNMFGVSPPVGSGNGCSGWYKEVYFRSLTELTYILFLEKHNIEWGCAEKKKYRVPYIDDKGKNRTYCPDFIVDNYMIVECKPERLWELPINIIKRKYAKKHFNDMGLEYCVIDSGLPNQQILDDLIDKKIVKLLNRNKKDND